MSVRVKIRDGEPVGQAFRRFKKLLERQRVWAAIRARNGHFVSDGEQRRKKQFKKRLKARLATLEAQEAGAQPVASLAAARATLRKRTGKP